MLFLGPFFAISAYLPHSVTPFAPLYLSLSLLLRTLTLALISSHHHLLRPFFSGPVISLAELLCPI